MANKIYGIIVSYWNGLCYTVCADDTMVYTKKEDRDKVYNTLVERDKEAYYDYQKFDGDIN